jgi:dTDP-4-dehydrorhamnose 3,5-epimerase
MQVAELALPGVLEIVPDRHGDSRGFFSETYQQERFERAGISQHWIQDNHSKSAERNTLRGLHFQREPHAQDKLVRVLRGAIFDVAVDLRRDSPTYAKWVARILSTETFNQLLIPKGFAHGFLTLEPETEVFYKVSAPYAPTHEVSIRWDDPDLAISWPIDAGERPILSPKDGAAPSLTQLQDVL